MDSSYSIFAVIPIAIAASFDIALDLNHGGVDDQFNKLVRTLQSFKKFINIFKKIIFLYYILQ